MDSNIISLLKSSGISCSVFSLRYDGDFGIGDIKGLYLLVDFLHKIDFYSLKLMPINEPRDYMNYDPFNIAGIYVLDPLIINVLDIEDFDQDKYAAFISRNKRELGENSTLDFQKVKKFKDEVFTVAFDKFYELDYLPETERGKDFIRFVKENEFWIEKYGVYKVLMSKYNNSFDEWPDDLLSYDQSGIDEIYAENKKEIRKYEYLQWLAYTQWKKFMEYASKSNVCVIGEVPLFVGKDSLAVWANREYFDVNKKLKLNSITGTPPNSMYPHGELWDLPVYNWKNLKKDNYAWFLSRMKFVSELFHGIEIKSFKSLYKYWKVVNGNGKWENGAGEELINLILKEISDKNLKPIFSDCDDEDPEEIEQLRKEYGIIGIKVFSNCYKKFFSGFVSDDDYINFSSRFESKNILSWWQSLNEDERKLICEKLAYKYDEGNFDIDSLKWKMLEQVLFSPGVIKLFDLEDLFSNSKNGNNNEYNSENRATYRMDRSLDSVLTDDKIIDKLRFYSDLFSLNSSFSDFKMRVIPQIHDEVKRSFLIGEEINIWALSENENTLTAITDMPIESNLSDEIKEIPLQKVKQFEIGSLYSLCIKSVKEGEYVLSLKSSKDNISSFENKLLITVKKK